MLLGAGLGRSHVQLPEPDIAYHVTAELSMDIPQSYGEIFDKLLQAHIECRYAFCVMRVAPASGPPTPNSQLLTPAWSIFPQQNVCLPH